MNATVTHSTSPWTCEATDKLWTPGRGLEHPLFDVRSSDGVVASNLIEPDARLIASAPDLLAACEAALAVINRGQWPVNDPAHDVADQLQAAIRRARGA